MKEQEAYKAVVQNQIVDDDKIRRYARTAAPERKRVSFCVWKPVAIALAALVLAFGVTMAIPSARAEVMRWFAPTNAREYFSQDPESREPNKELDTLIVPGESSDTHVEIHEAAEGDIYRTIAEALGSVELGETMYDGEYLYIRMKVNGLGMLAAIEPMTGGNLTGIIVPPEETPGYFEDYHTPPEFLSGEVDFWDQAIVSVIYTFADGTRIEGGSFVTDDVEIRPLLDSLRRDDLDHGTYSTPDQFAEINAREVAYLKDRTISACAMSYMKDTHLSEAFRTHADRNGLVTVTVGMQISHCLSHEPWSETMLDATLGEVTFDLYAYLRLMKTELKPCGRKVTFAPEETIISHTDWEQDESGAMRDTIVNVPVDLGGLTMEPLDGAYIDALGIQNLQILLTPPKGWDRNLLKDLDVLSLDFMVEIDGQRIGHANSVRMTVTESGSVLITIGNINDVPLKMLGTIKNVTLIPTLQHITTMRVYTEDVMGEPGKILSETALEPGVVYREDGHPTSWPAVSTEYPQYAITFTAD